METHGCYPVHIDFCVCQQFPEFFMGDNLTQQPVVEAFAFQKFHNFIIDMQLRKFYIFWIAVVCPAKQIIGGHLIKVCQF